MTEAEINASLHDTARKYPRAWGNAHRENHPERWDFIILAVRALWVQSQGTVGGNWRRGVVNDLSMDGLSVWIDGEWRFADIIGGAGAPGASLGYRTPGHEAALRDPSGQYIGLRGVATPDMLPPVVGVEVPPTPAPTPPPTPRPYWGDDHWPEMALYGPILDAFAEANHVANREMSAWFSRFMHTHKEEKKSITETHAQHVPDLRRALGLPPQE